MAKDFIYKIGNNQALPSIDPNGARILLDEKKGEIKILNSDGSISDLIKKTSSTGETPDLKGVLIQGNNTESSDIILNYDTFIKNEDKYIGFKLKDNGSVYQIENDSVPPISNILQYSNISPISTTSSSGYGLVVDIIRDYSTNEVWTGKIISRGNGYEVGDTVTFAGSDFGLSSPDDDKTFTITSVANNESDIVINGDTIFEAPITKIKTNTNVDNGILFDSTTNMVSIFNETPELQFINRIQQDEFATTIFRYTDELSVAISLDNRIKSGYYTSTRSLENTIDDNGIDNLVYNSASPYSTQITQTENKIRSLATNNVNENISQITQSSRDITSVVSEDSNLEKLTEIKQAYDSISLSSIDETKNSFIKISPQNVEINTFEKLILSNLSTYADNAAALAGGLTVDCVYKTATGELRIVI